MILLSGDIPRDLHNTGQRIISVINGNKRTHYPDFIAISFDVLQLFFTVATIIQIRPETVVLARFEEVRVDKIGKLFTKYRAVIYLQHLYVTIIRCAHCAFEVVLSNGLRAIQSLHTPFMGIGLYPHCSDVIGLHQYATDFTALVVKWCVIGMDEKIPAIAVNAGEVFGYPLAVENQLPGLLVLGLF